MVMLLYELFPGTRRNMSPHVRWTVSAVFLGLKLSTHLHLVLMLETYLHGPSTPS